MVQGYATSHSSCKGGRSPQESSTISTQSEKYVTSKQANLGILKSDAAPRQGDLMRKAIKYFDTYWEQVWRYRNNGKYTIDNNLAERFIRPLANGRKNSLFFGSHKMARVSAAYHFIISTCKFQRIPILEYLKKFFKEIVAGNRDYQNLMPTTIGIPDNKSCTNEYKVKLA